MIRVPRAHQATQPTPRPFARLRAHGAWIRRATHGTLQIDDGALYTSLHRMEKRGWLDHEWMVSPKGRRAKYYRLTTEGRKQLRAGERSWARFADAVFKVFAARQKA